jgi:peroxisomal membrane protein 2
MAPQEKRAQQQVPPHPNKIPHPQTSPQSWESLDDDNDNEDNMSPLYYADSSITNHVDIELALEGMHHDDYDNNGDAENEESIRAFYDECQVSHRPHPMRHFSFSELSNESSPLLNPLKAMPKGTPPKFWMHRLWRWYNQRLNRRPVVTKSLTAGIIVSLGDIVGQIMEIVSPSANQKSFDVVRLARFCTMGLFLQAPVTHYYYHALDHKFPPTPHPWTWTTFVKLVIDQTMYAPAFLLAVIVYLGLLEGDSWHTISLQLQDEYVSTMVANWKLWIPATLINMAYVPPQFRVLYCNFVFFGWSIFLSIILNGDVPPNG